MFLLIWKPVKYLAYILHEKTKLLKKEGLGKYISPFKSAYKKIIVISMSINTHSRKMES